MVQLLPQDVLRKDVLEWKGIHLFHCITSSSSQKLRAQLNLKGIPWTGHHVEIATNEHFKPDYLSVNPRGLLPALVHNGHVFVDSDEIAVYLEQQFPQHSLIPQNVSTAEMASLLKEMEDLHYSLRKLSMRFFFMVDGIPKSEDVLKEYIKGGSGTVGGKPDPVKEREVAFFTKWATDRCTDEDAVEAAATFRKKFNEFETTLSSQPFLLGDSLSLVDLAWIPIVERFYEAGYPMRQLHPHLDQWRARLMDNPIIAAAVATPPPLAEHLAERQKQWEAEGKTFKEVCFPDLT